MRDISKNIRALRTAKGLTQEELAAALHVTRQTVSNYENGRSRPDIDMVLRIAQALETDANDVLYGPPVPPDRRRERRRILLGLAVTVGLAVLAWACWGPALAWGARAYLHAAVFPIRLVLVPCCAAAGGWTLMAAIGQLLRAERVKEDGLIQAPHQLGAEKLLSLLDGLLAAAPGLGSGGPKAKRRRLPGQTPRTQIRGEQNNRVGKIRPASLGVGQIAVLQDLQQQVLDVAVRLFDFIK